MHYDDLRTIQVAKQNTAMLEFSEGMGYVLDNWDEGAPAPAPSSKQKSSKVDKFAVKYADLNSHYNDVLDIIQEYQGDDKSDKAVFIASILDIVDEYHTPK